MKLGMFTSGYQRNPLEHCFQDASVLVMISSNSGEEDLMPTRRT